MNVTEVIEKYNKAKSEFSKISEQVDPLVNGVIERYLAIAKKDIPKEKENRSAYVAARRREVEISDWEFTDNGVEAVYQYYDSGDWDNDVLFIEMFYFTDPRGLEKFEAEVNHRLAIADMEDLRKFNEKKRETEESEKQRRFALYQELQKEFAQ